MKFELDFLKEALPGSFVLRGKSKIPISALTYVSNVECAVSIDTRDLQSGEVFLAINGNKVDGHNFLMEAIEKGASALIIQDSRETVLEKISQDILEKVLIILVPDTIEALISMARVWRQKFSYPVIGVTGSVGKTTTKEMIRSILHEAAIPACISYKNQNTLVGLSLNILRMSDKHKVAIFEVGISQKGEMETKVQILQPTIGVITTVGHAHMDGLGSFSEVIRAKKKLFMFFKGDNIGIINGDTSFLNNCTYTHPVIRFGRRTKNHIQARKVVFEKYYDGSLVLSFFLKLYKEKKKIYLKTNHKGNVSNALAAAAVAYLLCVSLATIAKGLELFNGFEERFEKRLLKGNGGILISDCYNANPESMRAALLAVHAMQTQGEKIAVLGDMLELGEKEVFWHRQIGRVLGKALSIKKVILVGERAQAIGKTVPITTNVVYAKDWLQATEYLQNVLEKPDSLILVKGSHGMELHNLVERVTQ